MWLIHSSWREFPDHGIGQNNEFAILLSPNLEHLWTNFINKEKRWKPKHF